MDLLGFSDDATHVWEIFCPGSFMRAAAHYGLNSGHAFDITAPDENGEPWDLSDPRQQKRCENILRETKPAMLVGFPKVPSV